MNMKPKSNPTIVEVVYGGRTVYACILPDTGAKIEADTKEALLEKYDYVMNGGAS